MSYADLIIADQRLAVLQVLAADAAYAHNDRVLQSALGGLGHGVSADRIRTLICWLAEQELVTVEDVDDLMVAKLTTRGLDVALGRAAAPGVQRPRPGR